MGAARHTLPPHPTLCAPPSPPSPPAGTHWSPGDPVPPRFEMGASIESAFPEVLGKGAAEAVAAVPWLAQQASVEKEKKVE
jgi:hypothetical protein